VRQSEDVPDALPLAKDPVSAVRLLALPLLLVTAAAPLAGTSWAPASAAPGAPTAAREVGEELGHDRIGVRRSDTWYLRPDLGPGAAQTYREHVGGWAPVAGDTDGDGTGTVSLFRDGTWRINDGPGKPIRTIRFGMPGDQPVVGDWDADGVDSIGVFRRGKWFVRDISASEPTRAFGYGIPGDVPVVGDWDGDGGADLGVKRGRTWYQRDDATSGPTSRTFTFGLVADLPVAGDWDHDGKDTPGAFRDGTWFLRNAGAGYVQTRFGLRGDRPVVRRTPGLAPGVSHRVTRDPRGWLAHVVTVDLAAASTPDVVLARDRIGGTEVTSSIGRRTGAVVAVNGDYATSGGRPVHLAAADGVLLQSPSMRGRALGLGLGATAVSMGFPALEVSVHPEGLPEPLPVTRWNQGQPFGDEVAAFTSVGAGVETPLAEACYAGLAPATPVLREGALESTTSVTGRRCFGPAAMVPAQGTMLTANTYSARQATFEGLTPGQRTTMRQVLGFPGTVDAVGGNPMLVIDGTIPSGDVDGSGGIFGPNPRTAVGATADGRLLLVVVDGRQPGYSSGISLRDLAELMSSLGAHNAINLDGGGSSTMWLNGVVANRPSDGSERGVSGGLVVLPAGDPGEVGLVDVTAGQARRGAPGPVTPAVPAAPVPGPPGSVQRAAEDPASTGGLSDLR
jgi:hypothetical protein